jgi:malic enzyme
MWLSVSPCLQAHKTAFAHDVPFQPDLMSAIRAIRPTVLIGVSTIAGAFNEEVAGAYTRSLLSSA